MRLAAERGRQSCADLNPKAHSADKFKKLLGQVDSTRASEFAQKCGRQTKRSQAAASTSTSSPLRAERATSTSTTSPLLATTTTEFLSQLVQAANHELCVRTLKDVTSRVHEDRAGHGRALPSWRPSG